MLGKKGNASKAQTHYSWEADLWRGSLYLTNTKEIQIEIHIEIHIEIYIEIHIEIQIQIQKQMQGEHKLIILGKLIYPPLRRNNTHSR